MALKLWLAFTVLGLRARARAFCSLSDPRSIDDKTPIFLMVTLPSAEPSALNFDNTELRHCQTLVELTSALDFDNRQRSKFQNLSKFSVLTKSCRTKEGPMEVPLDGSKGGGSRVQLRELTQGASRHKR